MEQHSAVQHPDSACKTSRSDRIIQWISEHVLASSLMFYVAFTLPLMVLPMSDSVKLGLAVLSGSWIQWWALPALQRTQIMADRKRDAKATADHEALTYLANQQDRHTELLEALDRKLTMLLHPSKY